MSEELVREGVVNDANVFARPRKSGEVVANGDDKDGLAKAGCEAERLDGSENDEEWEPEEVGTAR